MEKFAMIITFFIAAGAISIISNYTTTKKNLHITHKHTENIIKIIRKNLSYKYKCAIKKMWVKYTQLLQLGGSTHHVVLLK